MENLVANQDPNPPDSFKKLLFERDLTIARLTGELEHLKSLPPEQVSDPVLEQKYLAQNAELAFLKKEAKSQINVYREQVSELSEALQKTREDYQTLRRQKGGFGFVALLGCLFFGALFGFGVHWLFFKPKSDHAASFQKFRDENQFNIEYDISQGRFDNIEATLKSKLEDKKHESIKPELEFLRKIMGATRRKLSDAGGAGAKAEGYSLNPETSEMNIQEKAKKSLTIKELEATIRGEASTASEKLGKIKKGETAGIWDKTLTLDKLILTVDSNRCEVQDYWYKIETADGLEGWVFGYFTNRSLNRVSIVGTPAKLMPPVTKPTETSVLPVEPKPKPAGGNDDNQKPGGN